jgi:hypothetical protein
VLWHRTRAAGRRLTVKVAAGDTDEGHQHRTANVQGWAIRGRALKIQTSQWSREVVESVKKGFGDPGRFSGSEKRECGQIDSEK